MTSTASTSSATKWIGEVPSGWRVLEPRRVFSLRRESEHPGDVHLTPSQKYGVLPQEEYMAITGSRVVRNLSGTTMQHVEVGDFISHLRTFQGGLELAKQTGKVSPAYTVVTPGPEAFPDYYKYVLKSQGYISQIASVTDQLRDGQSMRFPEFNETWLPVPPLAEQKLIADYLDRETAEIDAFIMELDRFMSLTEERRNAARSKFFSPSHAENLLPIKRVARLAGGAGFPPAYQGITDEELPFYKVGSLNSAEEGKLTYASDSISRSTARSLGAEVLPAGSVVMAKIGAALFLRRNALLTKPGCIDNNMLGLIPASLVDGRYLQEVLLTLDLTPMANPGAVPSLNMRWFRETKIEVPSLEVQNEVLARFSELDSAARLALADAAKAKGLFRIWGA